jgi:tRNA nucleotidyltransferase (CCA-adding enzyme)
MNAETFSNWSEKILNPWGTKFQLIFMVQFQEIPGGVKILKKTEKRFAEHPYIRGDFKGYHVEIIPCYLVENGSKHISAVDRTPFHDSFVKKNLGNRQSEVRLLKQFMKGIGCYGAEIRSSATDLLKSY